MKTPIDKTKLLYKFSLTEYVPETHWNTSRSFELESKLDKKNFSIDKDLIKFTQPMSDAPKFVLWNILQYKK